ncbi:MAG: AEC family transporter [Planctomycetaceae bacterium]|jgi:predicted permease|nr:AEC family transporter [Planctomycetaceae bacterium]
MQTLSVAFSAIISVLAVVLCGVVLRRLARVGAELEHGLVRLAIDILFPCLIFKRVIQTDAFNDLQNLWLPPLIGFSMTALGIIIGLAVTKLPSSWTGLYSLKSKRTFAACIALLNYGYLPIPLIDALFPDDSRMMGALFPMFLGAETSMWTLMLFTMRGEWDVKALRNIINGPILTIIVSVPLNVLCHHSAVCRQFFAPVFNFLLNERYGPVNMIGTAAIPVALLMIGLTINELLDGEAVQQRLRQLWKTALWSCFVRLVVMPVLIILCAAYLPCTAEIKRVMVIYAAMASAVLPIALSKYYGGSTETAFDTVMSNTLLALLTSPLWITAGLHWIGG